ncbi:MAG: hypothetical protein KBC67_00855 [Candidatus Pacebacteria bacterium]|nr:hypothetical protein [Candidatus Paceibacterota bacterium]
MKHKSLLIVAAVLGLVAIVFVFASGSSALNNAQVQTGPDTAAVAQATIPDSINVNTKTPQAAAPDSKLVKRASAACGSVLVAFTQLPVTASMVDNYPVGAPFPADQTPMRIKITNNSTCTETVSYIDFPVVSRTGGVNFGGGLLTDANSGAIYSQLFSRAFWDIDSVYAPMDTVGAPIVLAPNATVEIDVKLQNIHQVNLQNTGFYDYFAVGLGTIYTTDGSSQMFRNDFNYFSKIMEVQ